MTHDVNSALRLKLDYSNAMEPIVGEHGLKHADLEECAAAIEQAYRGMEQKRAQMTWRALPSDQEGVTAEILGCANRVRDMAENFVVLGIGGSALGAMAVHQALRHLHYNEMPHALRGGPRLYVEDNIDPERMAALLDVIDLNKTVFQVISKSGNTSETMSQLLIIGDALKKAKLDVTQHLVVTTGQSGALQKIADAEDLQTFEIPEGVGGRFSVLSPVGLLAAAVCGIDINRLLSGAAYMDELCAEPDIYKNPAYLSALLMVLFMKRGKNISVMMPYADSLKYFSDWYAQLWAESLGKRFDLNGAEVFAGQTPVKALGVTDQHSQVQLYTEGPFDKVVTFLGVESYRAHVAIAHGHEDIAEVGFLGGHTFNELIAAEQSASEYALYKAQRLSQTITLSEVNAYTIGQLLCFFEMQTAFIGYLLGIDAFNQPGVEEGKVATYALLGRAGFEEKQAELNARPARMAQYIL